MKDPNPHLRYLETRSGISDEEKQIIIGFIDQRNAIRQTSRRTKGKQAYVVTWITDTLHSNNSTLMTCTVHDLLKVAGKAGSGEYTKNSRQTMIMTLKVLAHYLHRFNHPIQNLDLLTHDVKAGAADCNTKKTLSEDEWKRLINAPMPAREKAIVAMLYDGYHRPGEILILNWSDLYFNKENAVEYVIKFKTELPRTIVQKPWATKILKRWAAELGAKIGETDGPIFPTADGGYYQSNTTLADIFIDLKKKTNIPHLMPSVLRNTAMKHDADAGLPVSYICLRAWGVTYNKMINIYMRPDSSKIQGDQHRKAGLINATPVVDGEEETRIDQLENALKETQNALKETQEAQRLTTLWIKENQEAKGE
jgi:integrase